MAHRLNPVEEAELFTAVIPTMTAVSRVVATGAAQRLQVRTVHFDVLEADVVAQILSHRVHIARQAKVMVKLNKTLVTIGLYM
jgi:hypothetical protein